MIQELQLRILPEQAASEQSIAAYVAREQGIDMRTIKSVRVLKRSIDARQRTVMINLKVRLYINEFPQDDEFPHIDYGDVSGKPQAVVVGAGPAGLFAALRLIELGVRPVVVERGKNVHDRRKDIARISREQRIEPSPTVSSIPAVKSGEMSTAFFKSSASMVPRCRYSPTPTRTSGPTSCRVSSNECATALSSREARCTSRPAWRT